jgi:dTDP-4-amino-4,6-dideoxygalactose transaminase
VSKLAYVPATHRESHECCTGLTRHQRVVDSLQVSYAESEFASYTGHKFCVGLNSCGSAIFLALWAVGVKPGDTVLSNALTFNAVPSAIHHAGANGASL